MTEPTFARDCLSCGEPYALDIIWLEDGDGDGGPYARAWFVPELATEPRCPACGAEPDADTLEAWLDAIAEAGWPADFRDREPSMTLPY